MDVILAITYHDPQDRLREQATRVLPTLREIFAGTAVCASAGTLPSALEAWAGLGAAVRREPPGETGQGPRIGRARRLAVGLALEQGAAFILYCDGDRALHWAEHYPQELHLAGTRIGEHDFTVLGRTRRAFQSHPRCQRDTEAPVNYLFGRVSGQEWDVTAGARGLSRRAAEAILAGCPDEELSTDVSWPLFLLRCGGFSLGYFEAEGLEFETADRHGDEVARAGSHEKWLDQLDADPRRWLHRVEVARLEIEALAAYAEPGKL